VGQCWIGDIVLCKPNAALVLIVVQ
jgi:hypothetical protein